MKRFFCITFCILLLCSCTKQEKGEPFSAFGVDFTAEISSDCKGNKCSFRYDSSLGTVTFLSPSELNGYTLGRSDDALVIAYDGIIVPVSEYAGRLLLICEYVFSAEGDDAVSIEGKKTEQGSVTVVRTDNCEYFFSSDGMPILVNGNFDGIEFCFELLAFEAKNQ